MKKLVVFFISVILLISFIAGCKKEEKPVKIGVCFVVGEASRWTKEADFMKQRAKELGVLIDVKIVTSKSQKSPKDECFEMIDNGIDVLIFRPKDETFSNQVTTYAKQKDVKTISYGSLSNGEKVDLFVGYDCERIGQRMGQYLAEMVPKGDYIILSGDPQDKYVSPFLYEGAMKYIQPLKPNINIILDASVPYWKPNNAKEMVEQAIVKNGNKVDAIFAPNDGIAGACAEVLEKLNITKPVIITGMDADLFAIKRIVAGKQACTMYMDLKALSTNAVNEAYNMAKKQKVNVNSTFDNDSKTPIQANLITGQLITKENIDRILIKNAVFTQNEVYGKKQ